MITQASTQNNEAKLNYLMFCYSDWKKTIPSEKAPMDAIFNCILIC